jgi:hypothetical protein
MPRVARRKPLDANIGVVIVGLDTHCKQCPGLYEDMLRKAAVFERRRSPRFVGDIFPGWPTAVPAAQRGNMV